MIIIQIMGGLGNQMFQYAFGRALSRRYDAQLKLDLCCDDAQTPREFGLSAFNIVENLATEEEVRKLKRKRLWRKTFVKERSLRFNPRFLKCGKGVYARGFWQCERYFKDCEEIIRSDFTFKNPLSPAAQSIADDISAKNAVFIHVRRGDYIANPSYVTDLASYYALATAEMLKMLEQPEFYIFSDDTKYARQAFPDFKIVKTGSAIEDMRLMSLCKHGITANSSFSWWGGWLIDNPEKIIISPKAWFATESLDSSTIIPHNWLRL